MRPVLSRRLVPAAAASGVAVVPALVAALVAGAVPVPGGGDGPTVHAVVTTGPLGYVGNPADPFLALDGAHPVTRPLGVVDVRPAVSRRHASGPDVSDTALPARVLAAYRSAARSLGSTDPACALDWPLLAGIGKVESGHAYGGAVDRAGDTLVPILGPALDGSPGVAAIPDTDDGRWDTDRTWDRAVGPMQFIPSSWRVHGQDGDADGDRDPNNVLDATLGSAVYLCTGERDLTVTKDRRAAVFSYNHSWDYVDLVLAWAEAYSGGTPVLTGALGDGPAATGPARGGPPGPGADAQGPPRQPSPADGSGTDGPPPPAPPPPAPASTATGGPSAHPSTHPSTHPPAGSSASPDPTASEAPTCPGGEPTATDGPTDGTATPDPSSTPTPTDSPTPTESPTAGPSAEPTPTGTPDPCAAPDASASPTPAATP